MRFTACATLLPLFVGSLALAADTSGSLPKQSPFELRGGPSAPVASVNENIEFAGVSSIGKKTDLIFYDKTAKKSHWIAQGETKEGIAVVSYDERREEAVVKVNGVEKRLALRKTAGPVTTPRPIQAVPAPGFNTPTTLPAPVAVQPPVTATPASSNSMTTNVAPAAPTTPPANATPQDIQTKQETEARMLVSDLLEIGMAQRRAYEEAQRKAAEGNNPNAAHPSTTATTGTPPIQAQPVQPAR